MPTFRKTNSNGKDRLTPWHARQYRSGFTYSLGYFPTKEEAKKAEEDFSEIYPKRRNQYA